MPLSQLSEYVSFATQDNFLFRCSLLENIRLGDPSASDEQVKAAARAAQCEEFIAKLPQGYDTPAGEAGKRLSGGEKQRIAIARMMLKNAPVVILDEATAFTDPENEDKLQRSIAALTKGKTLLVIAHRLSTIRNADNIVVLKNGAIEAQGTQQALIASCPLYRDMWQALIALAAVCKNVKEAIYASLKFIPQQSRLHEHLLFVVRDYEEKLPQEECFAHIHARWDERQDHDWCHTISNAEIVAAALLYGEEDYGKSICMAVQTGFDTDCNGATVGSVIGMCHGMGAIDPVWLQPVSGGLETGIFGLAKVNVEERIDMTMRHIEG